MRIEKLLLFLFLGSGTVVYGQLLNGNFEVNTIRARIFSKDSIAVPDNWYFVNDLGMRITDDAYAGAYAVQLWSWYYGQSNSEFVYGDKFPFAGQPLFERPESLCGFYKFTQVNEMNGVSDSGYVQIWLSKYNTISMKRDTIGSGVYYFTAQTGYTAFICPIAYVSNAMPDTIFCSFISSLKEWPNCNGDGNGNCNFLSIDSLSFTSSNTSSTKCLPADFDVEIFSNPSSGRLKVRVRDLKMYKIYIFSTEGNLVYQDSLFQQKEINTSNFTNGIYFVQIQNQEGRSITKKIIKK
ncbi:MAG: T9SS type A sorting domain-containing protein [Saprospiraceae bacterium]